MKKHLKQTLSLLLIGLMVGILIPSGIWAEENPRPELGPLNPDFIEYLSDLELNKIDSNSGNGFSRGSIPEPVARLDVDDQLTLDAAAVLPSTYDLRSIGRVNPVRDQDPFGSCWTFASLASLESYLKEKETVDLSENNMMRNHGFDWGINDGGNSAMALAYLSRWSGPVSESSDPYGSPKKTGLSPSYHIQSVEYISKSENDIKEAIMNGGALYTSMNGSALENPSYYNKTKAAFYYNGSAAIDHAVAIVGWDDNYSRTNFSTRPPGDGAWIIRNSWGSSWGEGGYFYLSYYDAHAGYDVTAFHNAESTDNYNRIYQYDPFGKTSTIGYNKVSFAWGANVFTAAKSENLTAVSTYASTPNTTIEIQIYTGLSSGQEPTSGQLRTSQTETFANAGYYTINLNDAVNLTTSEKFSVVIKYNTPQTNKPIPLEKAIAKYSSGASAKAGESFMSYNGINSWTDLGSTQNANVCIKAFTENASAVRLDSIAITKPASKLIYQIGDPLDLSGLLVTGTYSDRTTKVETVTADNISGFDSSKAAAKQVLTIRVNGKTATYTIQIKPKEKENEFDFIHKTDPANRNYSFIEFIDSPQIFDFVRKHYSEYLFVGEESKKYELSEVIAASSASPEQSIYDLLAGLEPVAAKK